MKEKISKRDWETISAYLDGQLSPRRLTRFKSHLNKDVHLQNAFEQLRETRHILRSTPRISAPRNFMLTPEMAGRPLRMPRLAPVFGWASAIASFLLVLVLAGDILSSGGFVPVTNNFSQQDAFVALRDQDIDNSIAAQPSVAEGMDVPLKGSEEGAAPPKSPKEDELLGAVAESELESALADEIITDTTEIQILITAEDTPPEEPDGQAGTTDEEIPALDTFLETPVGDTQKEVGEPQEEIEKIEGAESLAENEMISKSVEAGSAQEQPIEVPPAEEQLSQAQKEQAEPPSDDVVVKLPAAEPPPVKVAPDDPESLLAVSAVPDKTKDYVLGVEVFLVLSSLGAGLAWFYLRRRGD